MCDYSDAYIVVKGDITVTANNGNNDADNIRNKKAVHLHLKIMHDLFLPFQN